MLNLTQHASSPEQKCQDLSGEVLEELKGLLTFDTLPDEHKINNRASRIAEIAESYGHDSALIGGALWLCGPLERALRARGIEPFYAFSKRVSVDLPGGRKASVFKHIGFVRAI